MEEFGPTIYHIKKDNNIVAECIILMDKIPASSAEGLDGNSVATQQSSNTKNENQAFSIFERIQTRAQSSRKDTKTSDSRSSRERVQRQNIRNSDKDREYNRNTPISYKTISKHQWEDPNLVANLSKSLGCKIRIINKHKIVFDRKNLMPVPKPLQEPIILWYHVNLCHPGLDRTEQTIRRKLTWMHLREDVRNIVKSCNVCQRLKRHTQKYGELPPKTAEAKPWIKLCVD